MSTEKEQSLKQIIEFRRQKLEQLKKLGVNPYPYTYSVSHSSRQVIDLYSQLEGKSVSIAGRMISIRRMGKASFFHLQDEKGKVQVYIKEDKVGEKTYQIFDLLDIGDVVGVKGAAFTTKKGEISVSCESLTVLAKSIRPLPGAKEKDGEKYSAFSDKEQRYRHRHLDIIVNPEVKDVFLKRAKIIASIRSFLNERGYLEVETPVLQPLYGGAFAQPFKTVHNALDRELYLRISDELYLKRLIIGGFERLYELSKVFRNEGMDKNHNPEFSMVEFYTAYADYHALMGLTEELIRYSAKAVGVNSTEVDGKTIDLSKPFRRAYYLDLLGQALGEELTSVDEKRLREICKERNLELGENAHLGRMYDILMREFVEPFLIEPTFVLDYPKATSPLAKLKRDSTGNLVERFELFIGGSEIANAFTELNDPLDQRDRLEAQAELRARGDLEAQTLDEDFLKAMEMGMPPTGGVGMGVDRLVMLLTANRSIRDVILFPALRSPILISGSGDE